MSRRRNAGLRDTWVTAVLASKLHPACKLVCIALSRHMSDDGKVRQYREDIAADLGWKTAQRVTDRIKEAKDAGFLSHVAGGVNGTASMYQVMIPANQVPRLGVRARRAGNGSRGTCDGVPGLAQKVPAGTPPRGGIRARGTYKDREQEPAPADSRAEREHDLAPQAGNYRRWLPTPVDAACPDTTGEVA